MMMKKHVSVLMFCVQNKVYKILPVLFALAAVNNVGFRFFGLSAEIPFGAENGTLFLSCTFLAAFVGCALCCLDTQTKKSMSGYTLQRLQISERSVLCWDALADILCFLLLWMAEIISVCILAMLYQQAPLYDQGPQGMIMAFYRSEFLHGLIPMAQTGLWLRNGLYVLCCGIHCACLSLETRYRRKQSFFFAAALTITTIRSAVGSETGSETYILTAIICIFTIAAVVKAMTAAHSGTRRVEHEEPENENQLLCTARR